MQRFPQSGLSAIFSIFSSRAASALGQFLEFFLEPLGEKIGREPSGIQLFQHGSQVFEVRPELALEPHRFLAEGMDRSFLR